MDESENKKKERERGKKISNRIELIRQDIVKQIPELRGKPIPVVRVAIISILSQHGLSEEKIKKLNQNTSTFTFGSGKIERTKSLLENIDQLSQDISENNKAIDDLKFIPFRLKGSTLHFTFKKTDLEKWKQEPKQAVIQKIQKVIRDEAFKKNWEEKDLQKPAPSINIVTPGQNLPFNTSGMPLIEALSELIYNTDVLGLGMEDARDLSENNLKETLENKKKKESGQDEQETPKKQDDLDAEKEKEKELLEQELAGPSFSRD